MQNTFTKQLGGLILGSVTVSEYWIQWMEAIIKSGCRKSKAEICEEGLKSIKIFLDREANELLDAREIVKQRVENDREE